MAAKKRARKKAGSTKSGNFVPQARPYVSEPIRFRVQDHENPFYRADIQLHGLDHSGPSYEARVFLNNANADGRTPQTAVSGYAGSFYVFGHGTCFGDPGHCEVHADRRTRDFRAGHPLTPAFKRLTITEALRRVAAKQTAITVTIVPIITGGDAGCDLQNALRFERLHLVTYD